MASGVGAVVLIVLVVRLAAMPLLRRLVRWRLGAYVRTVSDGDPRLPQALTTARRVAVIGGGVAGLTAALTLARRGFAVAVFEANDYLGGKLGSWKVELAPGVRVDVSHGFHAFFPNYHNLNRLLDSLRLREGFASIGDYVIMAKNGDVVRFGQLERTPALNLLSLARAGVFRLRDALAAPGRNYYGILLEYDPDVTFARYDDVSFEDFCSVARVPPKLRLAFNTFARAFFADPGKLSLAELIKSFHFYYLGQDAGLVYLYPTRDYQAALLTPLRAEIARLGGVFRLGTRVRQLARAGEGFLVNGEPFDATVLAADVTGVRDIASAAQGIPEAALAPLAALAPGQRYAVLRLWTDRDVRADIPAFVVIDRVRLLDALTAYHRVEEESAAWVRVRGGAVLELHCYAVPEDVPDAEVKGALLAEAFHFFPELSGMEIRFEAFQLRRDFTAFHVGLHGARPTVETGVPGLVCAGDWVKLPFPAMLLEAACASGLVAANALLREAGLRQEPVLSIPPRGLMAGAPQPPARRPFAGQAGSLRAP